MERSDRHDDEIARLRRVVERHRGLDDPGQRLARALDVRDLATASGIDATIAQADVAYVIDREHRIAAAREQTAKQNDSTARYHAAIVMVRVSPQVVLT